MADKILPEGIRFFDKNAGAPDFVLGTMVITLNDLVQFAKVNPDYLSEYQGKKQLKLQILRSQKGGIYANVDTWKPGAQRTPAAGSASAVDDLPFNHDAFSI
jgi:hypothetical protein